MNQIPCCDWLPERARWSDTARSRLPVLIDRISPKTKRVHESFFRRIFSVKIIKKKICEFSAGMKLRLVHKNAKRELGQYPDILTELARS